jgi:6-pyruvoyltetrahydropterin/6-carboxytetrahydropterin synthase
MLELTKTFGFEAAHTLSRQRERAGSLRVHGHSYEVEVTLRGEPDAATGMVMDIGLLAQHLAWVREQLDHRLLDEVEDLGPPTIENLARFIWRRLQERLPGLYRVAVGRPSLGDLAAYYGDGG